MRVFFGRERRVDPEARRFSLKTIGQCAYFINAHFIESSELTMPSKGLRLALKNDRNLLRVRARNASSSFIKDSSHGSTSKTEVG